ncbi:MAG: DUF4381 family protein [Desulfobacteraceae bacterium]
MLTILLWFRGTASAMAAEPGKESAQGLSAVPAPAGPSDAGSGAPMTDIHDIKPILAMGADWTWLYWALATAVLLILALLIWRWWKRRERPALSRPAAHAVAADEEAYGALDALAAENGMAPKQFYFRLSAILRRYMERRFDFPAAEMTTEELLPWMDQLPLDRTLAGQFKSFCRFADPVKFAGAATRQDRLAQDLAFARDFVRQTTVVDTEQTDCSASETTNKQLEQTAREMPPHK